MTEYAVGQTVRTRIDVIDTDSGDRIPEGAVGMIVGFQGDRLEVSPVTPRVVR